MNLRNVADEEAWMMLHRAHFFLATGLLILAWIASAVPAPAEQHSGLWLGSVLVDAVSEVNRPSSDLSFDLRLDGLLIDEELLATGSPWKYDSGIDRGIGWRAPDFDDSAWQSGPGPLGYGESQAVATTLSFGEDPENRHPTAYFRATFDVSDASVYESLNLRFRRDDGLVLYLNGSLILRENLPSSFFDYNTLAITEISDTDYRELTIPASLLTDGENLIAAEVHQARLDDDDLAFDLELSGRLVEPTETNLIPAGAADWRYSDAGDELPEDWPSLTYSEPGFMTGRAQFGFGDGDEETQVSSGPSTSQKNPVTYFRKRFTIQDPKDYSHLDLSLLRDDGAVVYLNGEEILRSNMPEGSIDYQTSPMQAVASSDEDRFYVAQISADRLQAGENVLAVSVHQHRTELTPFEGTAPPTRTASQLDLRLLLHVDSEGVVRLLKEVIQMWQDGTLDGDGTLADSGRHVLLTDHELIPQFKGVAVRDGSLVGRRISAIGFDFPGQAVEMDGSLAPAQTVSASFELPPLHPTHPHRHRYHPDHDQLDATYSGPAEEINTIGREIRLDLESRYPPDPDKPESSPPPGWGLDMLGGVYTEIVTGLHKDPIEVKGVFTLIQIAKTEVLND